MSLANNLDRLKCVQEMFEHLSAGKHIDSMLNADWWLLLQGEYKDDYATLFKHLGKTLFVDPRGFAYFNFDDFAPQIAARQVALLFLLILDKKHSEGADLLQFTKWDLDSEFITQLREKNSDLLIQENLKDEDKWNRVVHKAELLGFLNKQGPTYKMMSACWRFMDLYQDLAKEDIADSTNENEEDEEMDVDDNMDSDEEENV